jgi:hypothetical protein
MDNKEREREREEEEEEERERERERSSRDKHPARQMGRGAVAVSTAMEHPQQQQQQQQQQAPKAIREPLPETRVSVVEKSHSLRDGRNEPLSQRWSRRASLLAMVEKSHSLRDGREDPLSQRWSKRATLSELVEKSHSFSDGRKEPPPQMGRGTGPRGALRAGDLTSEIAGESVYRWSKRQFADGFDRRCTDGRIDTSWGSRRCCRIRTGDRSVASSPLKPTTLRRPLSE